MMMMMMMMMICCGQALKRVGDVSSECEEDESTDFEDVDSDTSW
jgi:hypothetical protein